VYYAYVGGILALATRIERRAVAAVEHPVYDAV
jgi:hypothetical protein